MPAQDDEFDVFFSPHSRDQAMVRDLLDRLAADDLKIWYDEDELPVARI